MFNQNFIYYVLKNIIYEIQPVIMDIIEELVIALVATLKNYLNKVIIIYICLFILVMAIEFVFLIKNKSDIYFIKQVFLFLYNYENNQLKKEYEINFLEKVAKEFNLDNLVLLEKIKKDNSFFFSLISSNILANQINENSTNQDNSHIKLNDKPIINKGSKIRINEKPEEFLKNNLEQNSMNGSLLNNSINNNSSMVQLINKNNNKDILNDLKNPKKPTNRIKKGKKSKSLKNNETNKDKFNVKEKIFKENEEVLELLKTNTKIVPLSTVISIYISIIVTLLFLGAILISLFDLFNKSSTWEYSVNLSMNYLEKIPKIIELGFTAYLSVINGKFKAAYYPLNEYKLRQTKYLTFFLDSKGYDQSELISTNMNPSYFMNKLYDNYRIKKNLEFCENDSKFKGHFSETKYWIKKLNEKNNYCANAALGGALFFNKDLTLVSEYFLYVNNMAFSCREEGEKLDESGLDLEMDFILQELSYMFSDFEQQMKTNLTQARYNFFANPNNLRILKDMNVPFSFGSGAIYSAVNKDMENMNNYISNFELVFIAIIYVIDGLFMLYIFTIVSIKEKDKNILSYITKIMQTE